MHTPPTNKTSPISSLQYQGIEPMLLYTINHPLHMHVLLLLFANKKPACLKPPLLFSVCI